MKINFIEKETGKNIAETEMFPMSNGDFIELNDKIWRLKRRYHVPQRGYTNAYVTLVSDVIKEFN